VIWPLGDCLISAEHLEELKRVEAVDRLDFLWDPSEVRYADVC
jgi:hypothetical protein